MSRSIEEILRDIKQNKWAMSRAQEYYANYPTASGLSVIEKFSNYHIKLCEELDSAREREKRKKS